MDVEPQYFTWMVAQTSPQGSQALVNRTVERFPQKAFGCELGKTLIAWIPEMNVLPTFLSRISSDGNSKLEICGELQIF